MAHAGGYHSAGKIGASLSPGTPIRPKPVPHSKPPSIITSEVDHLSQHGAHLGDLPGVAEHRPPPGRGFTDPEDDRDLQ
ncbi:hypothetical protein [Protofrankia symbiont of Coriaria ruscifolia]|uniref:hypothetical protein n=1 Tax=Protofrankia symbiont of Coriaria ruscifolia TaxID=1306542 RepID=UPI001A9476BA|nr:hypothetical protein [Protofrankia symbiont of Coriaria ruscifolia]